MDWHVKPSKLKGSIAIPPSKSQTLRAILFGALASGKSKIFHPLDSPDTEAMIKAVTALGAKVVREGTTLQVEGAGGNVVSSNSVIDAGNSGIVARFIAAVASLGNEPITVTGDYSIQTRRPMTPLIEGLTQLGASARSINGSGYAPVMIHGPLKGGRALVEGGDSQPVSALLIAASLCPYPTEIRVINPGEKPWIAMTLDWLMRMGLRVEHDHFSVYRIAGSGKIAPFTYAVPGDFSSAAFSLAAALVSGSQISLHNLDPSDLQGDKAIIDWANELGAQVRWREDELNVQSDHLKGQIFDVNCCIDTITILAVLGCFAEGETRIVNGAIARKKESDRIACITQELKKMGARIAETDDGLVVRQSELVGTCVNAHNDHRMAMSLAVAAMGAHGMTRIKGVECVAKTYPNFARDFQRLGAHIEEVTS